MMTQGYAPGRRKGLTSTTKREEATHQETNMTDRIKESKLTGAGGIGTPRPGAVGMTKQVTAASTSEDCKKTVREADPRPRSQKATGTNTNKTKNMESTNKDMKITGAGEIGGPRPGAEGIERVPSASLSYNRGGEQVGNQACSRKIATGNKDGTKGTKKANAMELPTSEESSGEETPLIRRISNKRRKWTISSTASSGAEAMVCSNNESDGGRASERPRAPPPAKASKRLPTEEERLAELRQAPTANLAVNILEVADSIEQMASTSNNLKGTYVRRLRDDAGKARANVTELAKRATVTGAQIALEQENLQLRAKLQQANEEIAELKRRRQTDRDEAGDRSRPAAATGKKAQTRGDAHLEPPKQVSTNEENRVRQRADLEEEEASYNARKEIRMLAKQVRALRDLVWQYTQAGAPPSLQGATRQTRPTEDGGRREMEDTSEKKKGKKERSTKEKAASSAGEGNKVTTSPSKQTDETTTWAKVVGRREKEANRKKRKQETHPQAPRQEQQTRGKKPAVKGTRKSGERKIRPPRRAAVAMAVAPGSTKSCEEVLTAARAKVHLPEIGIPNVKIRYTIAGGILVEIPGENSTAKADELAGKLKEAFAEDREVRITRPVKRSEIRISGLDASVRAEEVANAIAANANCQKEEIKIGEIRKRTPRGLGAVWVQCPTAVAKKIAEKGKITIGWVAARVEVLRTRPMTCYRCMERGHTARNCTSEHNRSNQCYNCGGEDHQARTCSALPRCPVCSTAGKPANHRFGGRACNPPTSRNKSRGKESMGTAEKAALQRTKEDSAAGAREGTADKQTAEASGPEEAMDTTEGWP